MHAHRVVEGLTGPCSSPMAVLHMSVTPQRSMRQPSVRILVSSGTWDHRQIHIVHSQSAPIVTSLGTVHLLTYTNRKWISTSILNQKIKLLIRLCCTFSQHKTSNQGSVTTFWGCYSYTWPVLIPEKACSEGNPTRTVQTRPQPGNGWCSYLVQEIWKTCLTTCKELPLGILVSP